MGTEFGIEDRMEETYASAVIYRENAGTFGVGI